MQNYRESAPFTAFPRTASLLALLVLSTGATAQTAAGDDAPPGDGFATLNPAHPNNPNPGQPFVVTRKNPPEFFATEGPIWNINSERQEIEVVGKTITCPVSLRVGGLEVEFLISGSSVTSNDGEAFTGIGALNFDRLDDKNANDRDTIANTADTGGVLRLGPTRSIFSMTEGNSAATAADADGSPIHRVPASQAEIEARFFSLLNDCYAKHSAVLPTDFLTKCGVGRGTGGSDLYPATAGGTLKSAGHVYEDAAGNNYWITDVETVIELSENVSEGFISSMSRGDATTPDSFVMDELLVIFNQDPRFGADVLGVGKLEVSRDLFFNQMVLDNGVNANPNHIALIGYTIGEHVLFVQEILTDFIDPTAGVALVVERALLRAKRGQFRFRGIIAPPTTFDNNGQFWDLRVEIGPLLTPPTAGDPNFVTFPLTYTVDPQTGSGIYDFRHVEPTAPDKTPSGIDWNNFSTWKLVATHPTTGAQVAMEEFDMADFDVVAPAPPGGPR